MPPKSTSTIPTTFLLLIQHNLHHLSAEGSLCLSLLTLHIDYEFFLLSMRFRRSPLSLTTATGRGFLIHNKIKTTMKKNLFKIGIVFFVLVFVSYFFFFFPITNLHYNDVSEARSSSYNFSKNKCHKINHSLLLHLLPDDAIDIHLFYRSNRPNDCEFSFRCKNMDYDGLLEALVKKLVNYRINVKMPQSTYSTHVKSRVESSFSSSSSSQPSSVYTPKTNSVTFKGNEHTRLGQVDFSQEKEYFIIRTYSPSSPF